MKKLFLFLTVVGLVMAAGGTASVLAQTTYKLYATTKPLYVSDYSDFYLQYRDLDGDQKFSPNELISFSGVTIMSVTYTQILDVPNNNLDSPYTDGPNPRIFDWYFSASKDVTAYTNPNVWTYSQVPAGASRITVAVPGKTVVTDPEGDFLLRRCDPNHPLIPCSLPPPPTSPLPDLPGYFDIKGAQITQVGKGQVDLSIQLYEPIPAEPPHPPDGPYGFISYIWQFAGGCVGDNPEPGDKDSISVVWAYWEDNQTWEWRAYWYVITQCKPSRQISKGDSVPFTFTPDGVKVRVMLDDLPTVTDGTGTLIWHAAVRRIPFIYYIDTPSGPVEIKNTAAVDYTPDVMEFIDDPPYWQGLQDFATWEPR